MQRAVIAGDTSVVELTVEPWASAALMWTSILVGEVDPVVVAGVADQLARAGQPWDAPPFFGACRSGV